MTKLINLDDRRAPTFTWFATSGLFEWVNQFIRARVDLEPWPPLIVQA